MLNFHKRALCLPKYRYVLEPITPDRNPWVPNRTGVKPSGSRIRTKTNTDPKHLIKIKKQNPVELKQK